MKSVLVTGGTVRLGRAIAEHLRARGWKVLVSSHRPEAGADFVADLSDARGADTLYDEVVRALGGRAPDALVNNAALFTGDSNQIRAINVAAPRRLTARMADRTGERGSIVHLLDARLDNPSNRCAAYVESKRELRAAMRADAIAFAATLRVNAVAPGAVLPPTAVHESAGNTLLGTRPAPRDVAEAVAFLLTAEATTGCIIPVDCGQGI